MEDNMEGHSKCKNRTIIWFSYSTPEHVLMEMKSTYARDACIPVFAAALFTVARLQNQRGTHQAFKQLPKETQSYIQMIITEYQADWHHIIC